MEFESLVPTSKMDDNKKPFVEALRWAISNPNNKNIAITGTYGAGKSSLIETFIKEENLENKTVNISIATFHKEDIQEKLNSGQDEVPIENILEQQILQQLFYKVEPTKIPFSKFTRFYEIDKYKSLSIILFILLMSIITYSFFKFNWLKKAYDSFVSGDLNKAVMVYVFGIILLFSYGYFVYLCILIFQKLGLSKFGFGNTSIEVITKDNNTVFSKYLDEIIYIFKKSDFQYVVFEDLDRFDNIGIYERLKGLNIILNGAKQLSDRNIVFIYALKDDLFISNDGKDEVYNRTKFFDFIVPTIKIVHSSNAENLLLEKLKSELFSETNSTGITRPFLEDVALFVNDMRTLINICNEYKIYKRALVNNGITANGLLAFIVYKNIYPSDYSQLLNNQGKLYDFLNIKKQVIKDLNDEIKETKHKLDLGIISEEYDASDIELLFYHIEKDRYSGIKQIKIIDASNEVVDSISYSSNYRTEIVFNGLFDSCFKLFDSGFTLRTKNHSDVYRDYNIDFFNASGGKLNYLERYKLVRYKEQKSSLESKIDKLKNKVQKVNTRSVASLLQLGILECDLVSEIQENDELIYFLVRYGWIDESYEDYLSYFYEGNLSNNDVKLLKCIRNDLPTDFNLVLKNKEKLWEKLKLEDLHSQPIFNYDLLEHLLKNPTTYVAKLQKYIEVIFNEGEGITFYLNFIEHLNQQSKYELIGTLLNTSINNDFDIWVDVIEKAEIEYKETYVYALINSWRYISPSYEYSSHMKKFIDSLNPKQLFENSNLKESYKLLSDLDVKFVDITSIDGSNKVILVDNYFFEINLKNIEFLMDKVNYKNITNDGKIGKYIIEYKEKFLKEVTLNLKFYEEDEETFAQILNDEELEDDLKQKLLEKCKIRIKNVKKYNSIKNIVSLDKMVCNLDNILTIISHEEYLNDSLNLDILFNKKNNLQEFLSSAKNDDISVFEKLCNELLKSNYVMVDQLEVLLKNPKEYIHITDDVFKNTNDNATKNIIKQVELGNIYWKKELYEFLYYSKVNNEILISYLLVSIENESNDLVEELISLNDNGLLVWSEKLMEKLPFESNDLEIYINQFSKEVSQENFNKLLESKIPLIPELNNKWATKSMNILYFIKLVKHGVDEGFIEKAINSLDFWDKEIFEVLREKHYGYSIVYTKNNIDNLIKSDITQDMFNFLIKEGFNEDLIINLYNSNRLKPSKEFLNWLRKDSNVPYIIQTYNKVEVINSYVQQQNISKVINSYIKLKKLSKSEIYKLFSQLKPPYSEIGIRKGDNKEIEADNETINLMKSLKLKNVIASFRITDSNKIIFNNKRKF